MAGCSITRYEVRGWLTVCGGFMVHLTLGTLYTFGNMSPYLTSYIRAFTDPSLRYAHSTWIFAGSLALQGSSMFVGGLINNKLGPKITVLIGGFILSLGVALTGLALDQSFSLCVVTSGVMVGAGAGIAYASPLWCATKWLPQHRGLANGIVVAGFGGGAFIFDQVQTAFINPDNLSPDEPLLPGSSEKYYSSAAAGELLSRVPRCYYLMAGCYALLQIIGVCMISSPPPDPEEEVLLVESNSIKLNNPSHENKCEQPDNFSIPTLHPKQVLKTRAFYTLWLIFLLNGQTVMFVSTLYKAYGQTFIEDDRFLAILGSFASVGNSLGRIVWGKLVDRFSFKACMVSLCALMVAFMSTLIATPYGGKAMFFMWIFFIYLDLSGNFALLPTATGRAFGQRYMAINYGFVFTSQAVSGIIGAVLTTTLSSVVGWSGMFFLIAGFSVISMLLSMTFNVRNADGSDI